VPSKKGGFAIFSVVSTAQGVQSPSITDDDHLIGFQKAALSAAEGSMSACKHAARPGIVRKYFDAFVIVASAFGGATMVMAGAHWLFPGVGLFDRAAGGFLPTLVTFVLSAIGIGWQSKNIAAWIR
jgi:hypothetical protein